MKGEIYCVEMEELPSFGPGAFDRHGRLTLLDNRLHHYALRSGSGSLFVEIEIAMGIARGQVVQVSIINMHVSAGLTARAIFIIA